MMFRLHLLFSTVFLLAGSLNHVSGQGQSGLVQFHGSGSSVGSRCFWHILETLSGQTKISIRATYRSTGSGDGVTEFMGNITNPFNDFGSADYPLPKEQYDQLRNTGQEIIHLPVVMGAVGLFHTVPLQNMDATTNLNLTSCLVARIYSGEIEDW
jgi:ABC-type phosphate transport system substrate-binding protein